MKYKSDKIAWVCLGLIIVGLIIMYFYTLLGIIITSIFLILFTLFAELEEKKEETNELVQTESGVNNE